MPTYVYRCKACDRVEEVTMSVKQKEDHIQLCPSCGSVMDQVFFPPGIQFVGPGFHVNDYPKRETGK